MQTKLWNPYSDWRGLSELKPCRDAAEADYLAGKFNLNLMRNNGDQGVYVIAKTGCRRTRSGNSWWTRSGEAGAGAARGVQAGFFGRGRDDRGPEDPGAGRGFHRDAVAEPA